MKNWTVTVEHFKSGQLMIHLLPEIRIGFPLLFTTTILGFSQPAVGKSL